MKFKYRLAMLQKLAKEKERQEQIELGKLLQERHLITQRVHEIGRNMNYWYLQYNEKSWDPKETGLIENHLSFIDKQRLTLLASLKDLEDKIKNKRVLVNEAYKEKRKFERHEEYKKEEYNEVLKEKEARMSADLLQLHYLRKTQKEVTL